MTPPLLWSPSLEFKEQTNLWKFIRWLKDEKGLVFDDYQQLWEWSTIDIELFWRTMLEYFNVQYDGHFDQVLTGTSMPHCRWFEGIRLNYAEHVFLSASKSVPAIIYQSETKSLQEISWAELTQKVSAFQHFLLASGVREGDCVAAYLPCIPEATIAFLAVNSIGAIWSGCSPDFGTQSVIDRFAQISPKVLLACNSYTYAGKEYNKMTVVDDVLKSLPSVHHVVIVDGKTKSPAFTDQRFVSWSDTLTTTDHDLTFTRVPFSHPMWVVYSSGTTGLPKAITHSHGGILLEHYKYLTFHHDIKSGERCFWYTTTGWMMWNYIQSSLLCGATLVLYDGSPGYPSLHVLWKTIESGGIHHFGTSAGFILSNRKEGLRPGRDFDLSSLRSISSTGSTLPPEGFDWVYQNTRENIWLASMSGGTDVCSAFVGGNPTWPVYSGEIQCRALGCRLEAYDESGKATLNQVGEMVITQPMPSMPIYFWNDPDMKRYKESYFEMFPAVWRHGDWVKITPRNGVVIYGRSDATLNRGGIRIGTSEIYRAIDKVPAVMDSLVVCIERDKGEFYMPLFVRMQPGITLTEEVRQEINGIIRRDNSPRHVPDQIVAVPEIPYTLSGKKTETPVKKILMGMDVSEVMSAGSLKNPASINFFIQFYKTIVPLA